jgi:hypothetical protein
MKLTSVKTKLFTLCLFAALAMLPFVRLSAQNVNVAGALVGNGSYATLGDAFTAINGGVVIAFSLNEFTTIEEFTR